jgi:hypothetical protein
MGIFRRRVRGGRYREYFVEGGHRRTVTPKVRAAILRMALSDLAHASLPKPLRLEVEARTRGWRHRQVEDGDVLVECARGEMVGYGEVRLTARTHAPQAGAGLEAIPGARRLPTAPGTWVLLVPMPQLHAVAKILGPLPA